MVGGAFVDALVGGAAGLLPKNTNICMI